MTTLSEPLWTPSDPTRTQTHHFREDINEKYSLNQKTYEDLYKWSINNRSDFWSSLFTYENIIASCPPPSSSSTKVVDESASPADNPPWFTGTSLNWAENQLRHATSHPNDVVIIQTSEPCSAHSPAPLKVTGKELLEMVGSVERQMRKSGVGKGDRVGWYGGNCLEAVVVLLATSAVGAVFSSAAADFGVDGVVERLQQVRQGSLLFS